MWTVRRARNVGGAVAIALGAILLVGTDVLRAQTRAVTWSPVTTYTDGTPVESGNTVSYSIWRQDNVTKVIVPLAINTVATSTTFEDSSLVKGRVYNFWAQAHVVTGASSDNSAVYAWTLPLGRATTPAGLDVR